MTSLAVSACFALLGFGLVLTRQALRRDRARCEDMGRRLDAALARLDALERAGADRQPSARVRPDPAGAPPFPGPTLIAVPDLSAPPSAQRQGDDLGARFGTLLGLAAAGRSAAEVAAETGEPVGQVELVLGLCQAVAQGAGRAGGGPGRP